MSIIMLHIWVLLFLPSLVSSVALNERLFRHDSIDSHQFSPAPFDPSSDVAPINLDDLYIVNHASHISHPSLPSFLKDLDLMLVKVTDLIVFNLISILTLENGSALWPMMHQFRLHVMMSLKRHTWVLEQSYHLFDTDGQSSDILLSYISQNIEQEFRKILNSEISKFQNGLHKWVRKVQEIVKGKESIIKGKFRKFMENMVPLKGQNLGSGLMNFNDNDCMHDFIAKTITTVVSMYYWNTILEYTHLKIMDS